MWEIAVGAVQYLGHAFSRTRQRPERLFQNHVAPIHADLMRVQQDYTSGFARLSSLVRDDGVSMEEVVALVEQRRKELMTVRVAVAELARALEAVFRDRFGSRAPSSDSAEWLLYRYAGAVIDYMYGAFGAPEQESGPIAAADVGEGIVPGTRYTGFMRLVRAAQDESSDRSELISTVAEVEAELESSWQTLSERYATLKARCLA